MTDYLTKQKMGKGGYFPLRNEAKRATNAAEEGAEEPVLLDPTVPTDTLLIRFAEDSGRPVPRFEEQDDEWKFTRADLSIRYYHLADGTWNSERFDLMKEVRCLCNQIDNLDPDNTEENAAYEKAITELMQFIHPFAQFSAACLQVVVDAGLYESVVPTQKKAA